MEIIARIHSPSGVVGGGFLASQNQVFTASHVINAALGRPLSTAARPEDSIIVDFPFAPGAPRLKCEVVRWTSPNKSDVATLRIDDEVDIGGEQKLLADATLRSAAAIRSYGFPQGYDAGVWAYGELRDRVANGLWQLQCDLDDGCPITQGFSGCPVFHHGSGTAQSGAIIGMVARADHERGLAFIVPASLLIKRLDCETPQRGTVGWKINFFRSSTMTALLSDLSNYEDDGIEEVECRQIKMALENTANVFSDLDGAAFWENPLHKDVEVIRDIYDRWNGCQVGKIGASTRKKILCDLREGRQRLSRRINDGQMLICSQADDQLMEQLFDSFRDLDTRFPGRFTQIARSLEQYQQRRGPGA
ncbi:MAG: trypsin-like serine peptidase [Hyphomicrobium sp.]